MADKVPLGQATDAAIVTNRPVFKDIGDAHRYTWPHLPGVVLELDHFREARGDLTAEVTVYYPRPGLPNGLLSRTKLNLLSGTRNKLANDLRSRAQDVDWANLLEQACFISLEYHRNGEPTIDLREVQPSGRPRWVLYPYIEAGGPTILAAPGGAGKSLLALAMAYSVASGYAILGRLDVGPVPVLYLDYETSADIHAERLQALARGLGNDDLPPIFYRRMTANLPDSASIVRREIARLEAGLVIIDSLGFAGNGPPEEAATALELFRAVRTLSTPCLAVHHQRKTGQGFKKSNDNVDAIFGSVYFINSARRVWSVDSTQPTDQDAMYLSLNNLKANDGRRERSHALKLTLENSELDMLSVVCVDPCRIDDIPVEAAKAIVSLPERILLELREGPLGRVELAERFKITPDYASKELNALQKRHKVVNLPHSKWGLVDSRHGEG